jgi:glycosyltransferase involved in cell wall biosynthesis
VKHTGKKKRERSEKGGRAQINVDLNRIAIVIPAYNHEKKIPQVVSEALKLRLPLYIIDDGSTDATYNAIKDIPSVAIIRHEINRGKGAAIMTGFAAAASSADWVVTIDADGQHHPENVWDLLGAVPKGERPIIIGKRERMDHCHVPWTSRFGRTFSNFWVRTCGGPKIQDSQSGFRLYPLPETIALNVKAERFQFEVEILVRANWQKIPVLETPVMVTYDPRGERVSHYRGFVDFFRNAGTFSRLIFTRLYQLLFRLVK